MVDFKTYYGILPRIPDKFKKEVVGHLGFLRKENKWSLIESCHASRASGKAIQTLPTI